MQNTDSLPSCEGRPAKTVTLLGREVAVKSYICSPDGVHYRPKEGKPRLQLSILLTKFCDAYCPFCIAAPTDDERTLDMAVLEKALVRLKKEDCVRGISITGGEPFSRPDALNDAVTMIFRIFGCGMEVTIDTNGTGLAYLPRIRDLVHVDTVHISRHHWLDEKTTRSSGGKCPPPENCGRASRGWK